MKGLRFLLIALSVPLGFSQSVSAAVNIDQFIIATDEGHEVPPVAQENDREGEDDPGILKDAQNGDPLAQNAYAAIQYQKGNYETAAQWWLKAANKGHQNAQYQLGKLYQEGKGIRKSYAKAYALYMLSADQGYEPAIKAKLQLGKLITPAQLAQAKRFYVQHRSRKH
ncbi:MAG: tetratricopeptide repeat protein [Candidatus Berkiella sp.]